MVLLNHTVFLVLRFNTLEAAAALLVAQPMVLVEAVHLVPVLAGVRILLVVPHKQTVAAVAAAVVAAAQAVQMVLVVLVLLS